MNKLLKLQIRNIFHNKLFYVCLLISILTDPISSFILPIALKTTVKVSIMKQIINYLSSEPGIVNMIFITLFCTFDFTEGTTKNIIARGYNKTKYLISKYLSSFIGLLAAYGIIIIVYFILFFPNGLGYESSMLPMIIYCLFKIMAYTVLYGTIAFILEKNSSAIIANLFLPNIILLILVNADSILKIKISKYWIDSIGTKFIENPTFNGLINPIIMYSIYIILCFIIGNYFAKNKEVK